MTDNCQPNPKMTGDDIEIGHLLRLGGGSVRLTDKGGSIVEAKGEVSTCSSETTHMFTQAQTKTIAFLGKTVLKEDVEQGWQSLAIAHRCAKMKLGLGL